MKTRFDEMCISRADLRVMLYILGPHKMLEWVHSVGVCEDHELRSLVPPVPPSELRMITAAPELPEFLWTGLVDVERIFDLYDRVPGRSELQCPVVLDFGCGCGRMIRFLHDFADLWTIHGCEVNPQHVRWCQENLMRVKVTQCNAQPPLPYRDQTFNMIYGLSVFSHLSESNASRWLSELRRVLLPNGIIIVTTHGLNALEIIRTSETHQGMFGLTPQSITETIKQYNEKSFVYHRYNTVALRNANAGDEYGNAFVHPDYIFENWGQSGLKVVQYIPGGLRGWQDIVILQKISSE